MDVFDKIALDLSDGARKNYEKHGFVQPVAFLIINGTLSPLPRNLTDLMLSDKEKFNAVVSELVKKHNPLAVAIITEAWYLGFPLGDKLEAPSQSKDRKECVFVTVDSKEKQISWMAEIKDKKLGKWVKHPVYLKKGGEVKASGNMVDFYGTGTELNLPLEMHQSPKGESKIPKMD
ncbi:MAG TPA: hypothetical protein DET40_18420 [Lentisphaeria bacterium]|nr:MAG: hypothetical protein A2X45_14560 [Lentisphaerae bacterium GWF2_50_93]HCE45519.1 hypothetical protein [Lentisphaeria bacterium]